MPAPSVTYHQEFHVEDFLPRLEAMNASRITSFVNCPAALPCYSYLVSAQELGRDFEWRIHGIDGPDGNIKPTAKVGELMAEAGWAWHDKVTGDGFGHVIFGWAAVGRPLIGHGSHYAGQLAEPFWEDGVTCIDLDKHGLDEALQMVREISGTDRHRAMCTALRAKFEQQVDYATEARLVRAALL